MKLFEGELAVESGEFLSGISSSEVGWCRSFNDCSSGIVAILLVAFCCRISTGESSMSPKTNQI